MAVRGSHVQQTLRANGNMSITSPEPPMMLSMLWLQAAIVWR